MESFVVGVGNRLDIGRRFATSNHWQNLVVNAKPLPRVAHGVMFAMYSVHRYMCRLQCFGSLNPKMVSAIAHSMFHTGSLASKLRTDGNKELAAVVPVRPMLFRLLSGMLAKACAFI